MLGKGGAVLGLAAAVLLTAGGVGAAVATQPDSQPLPPAQPQSRVVTVLDAPATTTTTTAPPPQSTAAAGQASGSGSGSATITVIINR